MIQGCVASLKPQESPFSSTSTSVSWHRKSTEKQCLTIIEMKCERRDRRACFECRNGQHFNNARRRLSWQKFSYSGSQFSSCVKWITHFAPKKKKKKSVTARNTWEHIVYTCFSFCSSEDLKHILPRWLMKAARSLKDYVNSSFFFCLMFYLLEYFQTNPPP